MDAVVDQILNKLLAERERGSRFEDALTDKRCIISRINDLIRSETDDTEAEVLRFVLIYEKTMAENAELRRQVEEFKKMRIDKAAAAIERSILLVGLATSHDLATDAENLSRYMESVRYTQSGIL
jgi:hypothetical protein